MARCSPTARGTHPGHRPLDGPANAPRSFDALCPRGGGRTLALLDQALVASQRRPITATVTERLQTCAPQDIQELLPHLQARGDAYARDAVQQLTARGDAEAKAMREILTTQQKHIATTVAQHQRMTPYNFPSTLATMRRNAGSSKPTSATGPGD